MQTTLDRPVTLEGVNVCTGKPSRITFSPADDDEGISFSSPQGRARARICTAQVYRNIWGRSWVGVREEGEPMYKVEHVLSALYALGIDNVNVGLSDQIVPRFDDGVTRIIEALEHNRMRREKPKSKLVAQGTLEQRTVAAKGMPDKLVVEPSDKTMITYIAEYPHQAIGQQEFTIELTEEAYKREIMWAKAPFFIPFGSRRLMTAVSMVRGHGITEKNSLLIGKKDNPQYFSESRPYEFVRHKIMDLLGAFALLGFPVEGVHIKAYKTGHAFDLDALRKIGLRCGLMIEEPELSYAGSAK